MRRSALLFLCSIAPGGTVAGCFGSSTPASPDGGVNLPDTGLPTPDASFSHDSSVDAAEASVEAAVDAPVDSPPTGTFPTAAVDFGLVNCGSAPAQAKTYSFTNTGPVPITYSASVGTGTIFGIQGASSGSVAPGGTGAITLTAGTVPATSTAGTAITGTLTLTTDVPNETLVAVPLQVTPQGGSLTLTPATAGFNTVELTTLAPAIPLTITNVGNAPVGVSLGTPTDSQFTVTYTGGPGTVTVAAGAALPGASADFTPTASGLQSATSAIQTTGVLCASPATSIALSGTGTTAAVTAGPTPLDFGTVNCGAQSSQNPTVTVSNGYSFAIDYSTSFAAGSTLYTASPATGSVPAQGTATFTVTAKPIPSTASVAAGAFDDTLTVDTTAPGSPSATIALQESAQGAILGLTMANTAFGSVVAGNTGTLPFTVSNTGNVSAPITLLPSGTGYGAMFTSSSTAAGGGSIGGNATYTPQAAGTVDGSLGVSTSAVLCAPLPPAIALTATGVGPVATYAASTLDMTVTCGSGSASNEPSLTVTNDTAYPLTIDASSESGLFTVVAPADFTIPANSSGSISIEVPAVASGTTAAGTYSDHLLFQTNEFGNPTHSVPVSITVSGANLSFTASPPDPITLCQTNESYTITNSGNADATITIPSSGTGFITFNSFSLTSVDYTATLKANGGSVSGTLDVNGGACQESESQTYTISTSGAVCQGSPLDLTVNWDIASCSGACC